MIQQTRETLVGAAVLFVGGAFMTFAFTGGLVTESGYPVLARFGQVDGISVGSDVRISGVSVGRVSKLAIEPATRQAIVTMTIDEGIALPLDTGALIVQVGLLGSKFIKLDPGGEEEYLGPGDEVEFVQDAVIIIDMLKKVLDNAEGKRKRKPAGD
jgi:phospholipid/cholesterol/gamma-HCH transport system substrate-binding protein